MRRDTSVVPIGVSISQQFDDQGVRSGIVAVFTDLTSVLRMRDRMRASDRLAAVGELSAGIAHEIRNPLASIRGSVEMLAAELQVDGENRRLMELILRESERLNRIIEDFLAYARLRPQAVRNCHLGPLLDDLCTMMRQRDDLGESISIELSAPQGDLIVEVDQEQMTQVFLNLALNALQAMQGSGQLTITTSVHPKEDPPEVVIRFMDEGPGIDDEALPHLFDPFFTTKTGGTGLGLSMANRIVHNHLGRIEPRNLDGGGAEFAVHLPMVGVWMEGELLKGLAALDALQNGTAPERTRTPAGHAGPTE
jgi:two-component system sensor histidine kinase PilS (NtrC family)